jgi:hypothetical protein
VDRRLIAYYSRNGVPPPPVPVLRDTLAQSLPSYMVPSAFVQVAQFPFQHQRQDRHRPAPCPGGTPPSRPVLHRTLWESQLVEIWEELLGVKGIGTKENFFDLGGHSLLVVFDAAPHR